MPPAAAARAAVPPRPLTDAEVFDILRQWGSPTLGLVSAQAQHDQILEAGGAFLAHAAERDQILEAGRAFITHFIAWVDPQGAPDFTMNIRQEAQKSEQSCGMGTE